MRYRHCLKFGFIFSFFLSSIVQAKEPVKIIQILDTNLFKTADGKIISLAYVRTISIQDPDSFKQKFALKVYNYAKKILINRNLLIEFTSENDSIKKVHLWEKYLLLYDSVNENFLNLGYGYFEPKPESRYRSNYERAADRAKRNVLGIYNEARFLPKIPLKPNALWFSFGLGAGKPRNSGLRWNGDSKCLVLDASINFRRKWFVFTMGEQGVWLTEVRGVQSRYLTIGKALYDRYGEGILSIGVSRNRWHYHTESEIGTIESDYYYGLQLRSQIYVHLRQVLGIGLTLDANINREVSYFNFLLTFKVGAWNF